MDEGQLFFFVRNGRRCSLSSMIVLVAPALHPSLSTPLFSRGQTQRLAERPDQSKLDLEELSKRCIRASERAPSTELLQRRAENEAGALSLSLFLSTPTSSVSSLPLSSSFSPSSRHHHRPGLPRRRHALRPAQRRRHGRAMRPHGKGVFFWLSFFFSFIQIERNSSRSPLSLFSSFLETLPHTVGLPRLPPRLARQPRRGHGPHAQAVRHYARHQRQGEE